MSKGKPIPLYAFRPYGWSEEQSPLHCLLFYENYLLIGSGDGQIFWYDLKTLRPERSYLPNIRSPCLQLLRSGSYLISQSKAGDVSMWIQREGDSWIRKNKTDTNHTGFCRIQVLEVDGVSRAVGCPAGRSELVVYSVSEGKFTEVCQLKLPKNERTAAGIVTCFSAAGPNKVVSLHEANVMHLWDIRQPSDPCHSLKPMDRHEECEGNSIPVAVDFDVSMKRGVYTGMTDALGTFTTDGQTLKHFEMKHPLKMTNRGALSVVIQRAEFAATKSRILAVGCCDGTVRVYSWSTGRPLGILPHGDGISSVQDVAFSEGPLESLNSESVIVAAGADSSVSFWSSDFTRKT
ncbi:guanine nucleotide-binding protein subunit beta-like protein 1 [Schistocerca gregaria]|uniref:guanine nucleotide-binding protein subunit beta-like protein 1 n=1 Tax=Schistocerca gregaria TaxID=7010 RepID=UPI00211EA644|nr:guanine nucleotide-binding protein subunit beta-like protein 1 [Schistocerca gregaria]